MQHPELNRHVVASAHANIALVKYWGKRDKKLNLPCAGSLSLTLSPLTTRTELAFRAVGLDDLVEIDGTEADARARQRVLALVERVAPAPRPPVHIRSVNDFPTAAGLASSASAFAALSVGCDRLFELNSDVAHLSVLARLGSGSAARSLFGGFAEMKPGSASDGSDAHAVALFPKDHWPLSVVIAVVDAGPKPVGSTDGMEHTRLTSPYFAAWVDTVAADLEAAKSALRDRDFKALGQVAERSCLQMHASAMAADPGVLYFRGVTLDLIAQVRRWRAAGWPVFFTVDAGPNVKVFCPAESTATVETALQALPGVQRTIRCVPGSGAVAQWAEGSLPGNNPTFV